MGRACAYASVTLGLLRNLSSTLKRGSKNLFKIFATIKPKKPSGRIEDWLQALKQDFIAEL
jgi:hypothetical protein